ncbi:MAG: hypothetical protein COW32_09705 [Candidatus Aquicultor secundus]|uniref:hypothetical protein n=2 Tax=Candidatus Aquicultor secundus TaxID=1973895 RepID=UPI00090FC8FC|nr:hypothetical protein [Candidatus Aquicultor secundus]NCO66366.1 hypothetical protein [Solirubrobacter sp.]OIO88592.1 MAG: hypothetical protein AUK32_01175 [Candidatus Aquicultor secundus]PIU26939.1 MAG: hypothetical protein COT10_06010 [Candidatus Aquicultor secundus]PIW21483.1 MAG: hypothetical protein COW32_09705 [Candidatus Aquicultor secundus]
MKRVLALFGILVLLLLPSTSFASAPVEVDQVIKAQLNSIASDMKEQPDFWSLTDASEAPVELGQPYKVYNLDLSKIKALSKDYKNKDFLSALRAEYYWEYPLLDKTGKVVSSADIGQENGSWALIGYGRYMPRELIKFSADENDVTKYLSEQNISNVSEAKHVRVEVFNTDFIYVSADQGDYLIPLYNNKGKLSLDNKKLYPAADVLLKMVSTMGEPAKDAQGNLLYGGEPGTGVAHGMVQSAIKGSIKDDESTSVNDRNTLYAAIGLAVFLGLVGAMVALRQRHRIGSA